MPILNAPTDKNIRDPHFSGAPVIICLNEELAKYSYY